MAEKYICMTKPGIYKHYKGNNYKIIDTATHSETLEKHVIYQPLYGEQKLWIRPEKMFNEEIIIDGKLVKRFEWVSEK